MIRRATTIVLLNAAAVVCRADDPDLMVKAIRNGEYDKGIALLAKKIEQNPDDVGKTYDPCSGKKLAPELLEHGTKELLRMFHDRPVMLNHMDENGVLGKWAIRKLAGEDTGFVIHWDPTSPLSGGRAEHQVPAPSQPAAIRIAKVHPSGPRKGYDLTFEELWNSAVFELHNVRNAKQFQSLHNKAISAEIDREQYIVEHFRLEHRAIQQTRAFYCRIYLLWAREHSRRTEPELWYTTTWGGTDQWLQHYADRSAYPWSYYGRNFDMLKSVTETFLDFLVNGDRRNNRMHASGGSRVSPVDHDGPPPRDP